MSYTLTLSTSPIRVAVTGGPTLDISPSNVVTLEIGYGDASVDAYILSLLTNDTALGRLSGALAAIDALSQAEAEATTSDVVGLATGRRLAQGAAVAVAAHVAEVDPHTQYQRESEKDAANGYAGLDSSTLVLANKLGTGSPGATNYLRGDRTWQTLTPYTDADVLAYLLTLLPDAGSVLVGVGGATPPAAVSLGNLGTVFRRQGATMGHAPPIGAFATPNGRFSFAYANGNNAPASVGQLSAAWTRTSNANNAGTAHPINCNNTLSRTNTAATASWCGWSTVFGAPELWAAASLSGVIQRATAGAAATRIEGAWITSSLLTSVASNQIVRDAVPAGGSDGRDGGFGLRIAGTQSTWEWIVSNGVTANAPVDTGVAFSVGDTHFLRIWQDSAGVCYWEVWDLDATPYARLGGGSTSTNTPSTLPATFTQTAGFGARSNAATAEGAIIGCTAIQVIGLGGY